MIACTLFVLLQKAHDPFRAHLFGIVKEQALLPLMLPYKSADRPMFSEMSFKCRSSSSVSSRTLVPSFSDSTTNLLPFRPEKAVGLGIYTPKSYAASFLTPRPSLSSIRSHTTVSSLPPPSSPLPPLPAYFPEEYRKDSAMHRALHPPRQSGTLERSRSSRTVRIVPPSPSLSASNLAAFNKSNESLSSVYSRSISGEKHSSPRPTISDGSRSFSSGSTATVKRSPLGAMRLADRPDVVVMAEEKSRTSSEGSDSTIDDAATLQAMLPSVKAVSEFDEIDTWQASRQAPTTSFDQRPAMLNENGNLQRLDFTPLTIRKTRDSAALFSCQMVQSMA